MIFPLNIPVKRFFGEFYRWLNFILDHFIDQVIFWRNNLLCRISLSKYENVHKQKINRYFIFDSLLLVNIHLDVQGFGCWQNTYCSIETEISKASFLKTYGNTCFQVFFAKKIVEVKYCMCRVWGWCHNTDLLPTLPVAANTGIFCWVKI